MEALAWLPQVTVDSLLHHIGVVLQSQHLLAGFECLLVKTPHAHDVFEQRVILEFFGLSVAHRPALVL